MTHNIPFIYTFNPERRSVIRQESEESDLNKQCGTQHIYDIASEVNEQVWLAADGQPYIPRERR